MEYFVFVLGGFFLFLFWGFIKWYFFGFRILFIGLINIFILLGIVVVGFEDIMVKKVDKVFVFFFFGVMISFM